MSWDGSSVGVLYKGLAAEAESVTGRSQRIDKECCESGQGRVERVPQVVKPRGIRE